MAESESQLGAAWTGTHSGQLCKNLLIGAVFCNPSNSLRGLDFGMWKVYLSLLIITLHSKVQATSTTWLLVQLKEHLAQGHWKILVYSEYHWSFGLRVSCDWVCHSSLGTRFPFPGLCVHHVLQLEQNGKWGRTLSHSSSSSKMWSLFYQSYTLIQSTKTVFRSSIWKP